LDRACREFAGQIDGLPRRCLGEIMKTLSKIIENEKGALGWGILWLIGVPVPVLLVLFMVRGCT